MNGQAAAGVGSGTVELPEPVVEGRADPSTGDSEGDWLCASCLNQVANEKDRFLYNGKGEFTFVNPDGIRFEIITFSRAPGCREAGVPTLDYTWFAGHAWSYCRCGGCNQHLGWYYTGQHEFVGLITARLVRAVYLRN